jgi:hypothetical protein
VRGREHGDHSLRREGIQGGQGFDRVGGAVVDARKEVVVGSRASGRVAGPSARMPEIGRARAPRGLVFVHVPKAGGTTLRRIIRRQYPAGSIFDAPTSPPFGLPPADASGLRVIQGHVPYGAHLHLPVRADYITMLREPVDRIVSLFYYIRGHREHSLHAELRRMSLADFVASGHPETRNHQCRLVSGRLDDFTSATLALARENLATRFAVFGTEERFDESLLLFRRRLGWGSVFYQRENVTRVRPAVAELPEDVAEMICEASALDVALYAFARERLDAALAAHPPEFAAELRRFRRANRVYGVLAAGARTAGRAAPAGARRWARGALDAVRDRLRP